MKLIQCAIVSVLLFFLVALPAGAQTAVAILQNDLNAAVCLNDWNQAIDALQQIIGSDATSPPSRQQLVTFRYQLEDYRARGTQFDQSQNLACAAAIAAAENQPTVQHTQAFDWEGAERSLENSPASNTSRQIAQACTADGRCFNNRGAMLRHQRSWEEGDRPDSVN